MDETLPIKTGKNRCSPSILATILHKTNYYFSMILPLKNRRIRVITHYKFHFMRYSSNLVNKSVSNQKYWRKQRSRIFCENLSLSHLTPFFIGCFYGIKPWTQSFWCFSSLSEAFVTIFEASQSEMKKKKFFLVCGLSH